MRGRWRNFENTQSEMAIMGSACSPILFVLLVTLSGCIVSFSSESVPIHTFCSQGPPPINSHDNAMHIRRCPFGMRVTDPLVPPRRPSLKQKFAREFTLPVFSNSITKNSEGIHGGLCERDYSPHDGRRQGRTRQWAGNRHDDEGGWPTPHELLRTRSVLDAQAELYTLSQPGKVSSD